MRGTYTYFLFVRQASEFSLGSLVRCFPPYSWVPLIPLPTTLVHPEPRLIYKNHSEVYRVLPKQEGYSHGNGRAKEVRMDRNVPERDDRQIMNSENLLNNYFQA